MGYQQQRCKQHIGETLKKDPRRICGGIQVRGPNGLMMRGRMMFGEVDGAFGLAFAPIDLKLALAYTIADPIKPHIDCFGPFLFYSAGCDAACGIVVGCHGCGWLGVPHFFEGDAQRTGSFAVMEQSAYFGFGGARENLTNDVAQNVHGAVWFIRTGG